MRHYKVYSLLTQRLIVAITTLCLTSCASLNTKIAIYHSKNLRLHDKTYAYHPLKTLGQTNNLAYSFYSGLIDKYLKRFGMKKTNPQKAEYLIVFAERTGKPFEQTTYLPLLGQTGSTLNSSYTSGNIDSYGNFDSKTNYSSTPEYGITGYIPKENTYLPYYLDFYILKKLDTYSGIKNKKEAKPVYTAKIASISDKFGANQAFPMMIEALFKVFPGRNGAIKHITVYPQKNQ